MGYKFSLVLSREVTDEESAILRDAGCADAIFSSDSLPTDSSVTATKLEFDDTVSPTLAEAIESALLAVKNVPDLTVPLLDVPAQPAGPVVDSSGVVQGVVVEDSSAEAQAATEDAGEADLVEASAE